MAESTTSSVNASKMHVSIDNLPDNVSKDDVKVRLVKVDGNCKLEIRLPRLEAEAAAADTEAAGGGEAFAKKAKDRREDIAMKAGLYTIPERDGVKLPMKVIDHKKIPDRMKDIGGYDEAKLEVIEFVNFIKNPEQYYKLGARLPRGAILFGEPGTGKTLLARATAGEANVPFIACNSSEFLTDDGVEKLAAVFDEARNYSPCILFFDEIDCIGRKRAERWETPSVTHQALLEELLCQLDGFIRYEDTMMIVLGATNDIHNMDPALLRPGRFDRTITMQSPNLSARCSIFLVHLRNLKTNLDKKELAKKMAYMSNGMTGFIRYEQTMMIVLGATNDIDNMDPALLRPGRFDRTVTMQAPNLSARCAIFMVHLKNLKTSLDKRDLAKKMAYMSNGMTGAKISTVCNEAAMIAARDVCDEIDMPHFEQALDRVRAGLRKKVTLSMDEKKAAAFHDAGHAVYGWFTQGVDPPGKISIVPMADNRVTCSQYRIESDQSCTKENIDCLIMMTLAGKAAQEVFLGEATASCANDLMEATKLGMTMVTKYGMSKKVGPMYLASMMPWECNYECLTPLSDKTRESVLSETKTIIVEAFDAAKTFLEDHSADVEKVAYALMERDLLSRDDLKDLLGERPFPDVPIFMKDDDEEEDFLPEGLQGWNT